MAKQKVHSLTGRITPKMMRQAFKAVKRNRGAAGIDKVSIKMFEANLDENLMALMSDLKDGTFQPCPLRRSYIAKGKHELRPLGIPAVRDRTAQEIIRSLLNPIFEPLFHDCSFGFIKGRNCHMAVDYIMELHRQGYWYVLDADVKGFLDPSS
jgi:RNA-directed DNA polymerase